MSESKSKSAKLAAAVDYPIAYKQRKRPEKAKAPGLANAYVNTCHAKTRGSLSRFHY